MFWASELSSPTDRGRGHFPYYCLFHYGTLSYVYVRLRTPPARNNVICSEIQLKLIKFNYLKEFEQGNTVPLRHLIRPVN